MEEYVVMECIDRRNEFIFCPQNQSLQCCEYTVQMCFDGCSPAYKEVSGMYQLLHCPECLFNMPVLLFKFFKHPYIQQCCWLLLIAIYGIVSLVVFCVHRPKHFHIIKTLQVRV